MIMGKLIAIVVPGIVAMLFGGPYAGFCVTIVMIFTVCTQA